MKANVPNAFDGFAILSADDRIDLLCDAFEDAWIREAAEPDLASYLRQGHADDRPKLFSELALLDIEYRRRAGKSVELSTYARQFPEFAEQVAALSFIHGVVELETTVSELTSEERQQVGGRMGRFGLLLKLGAGGAGEVWKAYDPRLRRSVALKIPHGRKLSEEELHRFLREGRALAQLRHPNIVSIYEADRWNGTAFIVSELIDGSDLRHRLALGPLEVKCAATIVAQLAEALHYAHEQGVIHRDLKPANVLLSASLIPYVADFGLAKISDDSRGMTNDGQLLGTIAYMSPEQARGGSADADGRADIYSLGVILYEMVTGKRPFSGDPAAILEAVISQEPRRPRAIDRRIPKDIETVCLKALEKDPARRYLAANEMADDLRRFLRGAPILARRRPVSERSWRFLRRRPALAGCILLALSAVVAFAAMFGLMKRNRELLGFQTVQITTDPPGAVVYFVPLSDLTGEAVPSQLLKAPRRTPLTQELAPSDYLVIAVLNDGRFHEVIRRVPRPDDTLPGIYKHNQWRRVEGDIELPAIRIPSSVAQEMELISGAPQGALSQNVTTLSSAPVRPFFISKTEFTVADYRRIRDGRLPMDQRWIPRPDSYAVTVSYDEAIDLAELSDGRLPTEAEFECAATACRTQQFPWGDTLPKQLIEPVSSDFGPVGSTALDQLSMAPSVRGLVTGVAEWTSSAAQAYLGTAGSNSPLLDRRFAEDRIVKGGDASVLDGNASVTTGRDPRGRIAVSRSQVKPGLGFRVYRSAIPRTSPEAFAPK